jgi:ABC-type sugar transport system permease subunit
MERRELEMMRFFLAVLAYVVPTFALGFVWHLILFEQYYKALAIYRNDIIIPFGFLSMLIQATIFAWIYQRTFARLNTTLLSRVLLYAACGAALSWSFTTIAVAAKNVMTSVPDYLVIETAFTVVQWIMVGPLTALAFGQLSSRGDQLPTRNAVG